MRKIYHFDASGVSLRYEYRSNDWTLNVRLASFNSNSSQILRLADDDTIVSKVPSIHLLIKQCQLRDLLQNQAAFGASGQWLLVWATGISSDCCYFWDVSTHPAVLHGMGRYHKLCLTLIHCCCVLTAVQDCAASTKFSIMPYPSLPVCVLHESHGATFVAQAFISDPSLPRARQVIGLPNLLAACVLEDHSLFCLSKGKWPLNDSKIHRFPLVQGSDDRGLIVSSSTELGTAKSSVNHTARIVLVSTANEITVLICTTKGKIFKYRGVDGNAK